MRLFDRVASGEAVYDVNGQRWGIDNGADLLREFANGATKVVADEAAQYVANYDSSLWRVDAGDFGLTKPPMDGMWIEWRGASARRVRGQWIETPRDRHAVLITSDSQSYDATLLRGDEMIGVYPVQVKVEFDGSDFGRELVNYEDDELAKFTEDLTPQEAIATCVMECAPAFMALGWMNSRGVTLRDTGPPARLARARQRRKQFAGHFYKVLVMDAQSRAAARQAADAAQSGQRLHMVRGHFKRYTAERPLFGRYTGQVWHSQHLRGDAGLGSLTNEYHVTARQARVAP
jgi:hypothetical protein